MVCLRVGVCFSFLIDKNNRYLIHDFAFWMLLTGLDRPNSTSDFDNIYMPLYVPHVHRFWLPEFQQLGRKSEK